MTIVFFAVGYLLFWGFDPSNFPISTVKFIGQRNYLSKEKLLNALLPEIEAGFFRLKVSTLQQQLLSLPWIKEAAVRKVWPNQLVINFEEHQPVALWEENGLFSATGKLFYPTSRKNFEHLPLLQGPLGKHTFVWQQFLLMEDILAPLGLKIMHLSLAPRGAWHLRLSNGIQVILGTDDILMRLKRFVLVYEKKLSDRQLEISYVDLRYTSGMSIGWKNNY